jgi:hypothetical protein
MPERLEFRERGGLSSRGLAARPAPLPLCRLVRAGNIIGRGFAGFGCIANGLHVGEVLEPFGVLAGRQLVYDEVGCGNDGRGQARRFIDDIDFSSAPCIIERNARNTRENIDAERWVAPRKKRAGFRHFVREDVANRRTEFRECSPYCLAVRGIRADENIEVFGSAGLSVNADCICPDDKVFRAFSVEV